MSNHQFGRRPSGREIENKLKPIFAKAARLTEATQQIEQEFVVLSEYLQSVTGYFGTNVTDPALESLARRVQGLKEQVSLSREDWVRNTTSLETIISNLKRVAHDLALHNSAQVQAPLSATGPDQRGTRIISKVDPKIVADLRRGASS